MATSGASRPLGSASHLDGFYRPGRYRPSEALRRGPGEADVEQLVEPLAGGRQLDQNHDLAHHALEAADRLEAELVRFVGTSEPLTRRGRMNG
jgi:hypothetical protein